MLSERVRLSLAHGCCRMQDNLWSQNSRQQTSSACCFSLSLKSHRDNAKQSGCLLCREWDCIKLKNPKFRKSQCYIMGCKQTCPFFVPEEELLFIKLISTQTCHLLWRETLPVSSKADCYINIFERQTRTKPCHCLCSQDMQKYERPMENCLPTAFCVSGKYIKKSCLNICQFK